MFSGNNKPALVGQEGNDDYAKKVIDNLITCQVKVANKLTEPDTCAIIWNQGKRIDTGAQYALFNGFFDSQIPTDKFAQRLQQLVDYYSQRKIPFTWWWIHNQPIPEEIEGILKECGFSSAGEYLGMALNMNDQDLFNENPQGIVTKKVVSEKEYQVFIDILAENLQLSPTIKHEFIGILDDYHTDNSIFKHYLGYYQGQTVGTVSSFLENNTVGIYSCTTLPKARKKGVCSTLIRKAIIDAKMQGCTVAIVHIIPPNIVQGVCERIGFRHCCKFIPFVYSANTDGPDSTGTV